MEPRLRNLEIFRIFAMTENVTETARIVRISQPAVSQILKDLESQFKLPLFKRVGRRLQLTAEAQAILPDIIGLISQMGALRNRADDLRGVRAGQLSIASVPTLVTTLLPQTIDNFRKTKPDVRFNITSTTGMDVVRQVRLENADLGLTILPVNDSGVSLRPLVRTEMVCLVPRGHKLQAEKIITPEMLRSEIVIALGPSTPPGFVLRDTFEQAGIKNLVALEVNQSDAALPLVAQGIGIALTHPLVLPMNICPVIAIPFEPNVELTLALVYPKHRTSLQVTIAFIQELEEQLEKYVHFLSSQGLYCTML